MAALKHNPKLTTPISKTPCPSMEQYSRDVDQIRATYEWLNLLEKELQQLQPFVLTKEDHLNIQKWQTATSMMIQAKMRTQYSDSEHATSEKLKQIAGVQFIRKDEILGDSPK